MDKAKECAPIRMMPPNPFTGDYYRRQLDTEAYSQVISLGVTGIVSFVLTDVFVLVNVFRWFPTVAMVDVKYVHICLIIDPYK